MRLARGMVVLLATMLAATACTSEPEPTPTLTPTPTPMVSLTPTPTPSPSPSPSPSPEPSPSPTLSPDQQAAVDAVLEYFRLQDEVYMDNEADLQALMEITDGNMRRMVSELVTVKRLDGVIKSGPSTVVVTRAEDLEDVGDEVQFAVYACLDSTGVSYLDASTGEPAPGEATVPFIDYRLVTAHRAGWQVVDGGSREVDSCS